MMTIKAYKENGYVNMVSISGESIDDYKLPLKSSGFINIGHSIICAMAGNTKSIPYLYVLEDVLANKDNIELSMKSINDIILPAMYSVFEEFNLLEEDEEEDSNSHKLPASILLAQGDKLFWIKPTMDTYEVADKAIIGYYARPIVVLDDFEDSNLNQIEAFKQQYNAVTKYNRHGSTCFYINTLDMKEVEL